VLLGLTLALVALVGVACAPGAPAQPAPGQAAQPTAAAAANTPATAPAAEKAGPVAPGAARPARPSNLPVGVDADGNFYRGDPKAPVKLVEFSDFQ
jgi:protein-disulfide isomerase